MRSLTSYNSGAKYRMVQAALEREIQTSLPGTRLPSLAELMSRHRVSYSTVTRAIDELKRTGMLDAQQGRGTFVARKGRQPPASSSPVIGLAAHLDHWVLMDRIMSGVFGAAAGAGYAIALPKQPAIDFQKIVSAQQHAVVEQARVEELLNLGVDGILMTSFDTHRPKSIDAIRRAGIPVVFLCCIEDPSIDCVSIDDEKAGLCITRHLLDQGYRRIAFTGAGDEIRTLYGSRRLAGYERAMADAGLCGEFFNMPGLARGGSSMRDPGSTRGMCDELVRKFDAVLTWGDHASITLLSTLQINGYRVPSDLAIVGFNDSPLCAEPSINLSSLRQPVRDIGRVAFEIIRRKIEHPETRALPDRPILPFELVARNSSCKLTSDQCSNVAFAHAG